ncbi:hypothetical protein LIER_04463 [Lithospermum erythrorhizon]|uniref:Uncharacterized protein n=1 Tax=Lithospermum erythrorhizon TaxID=34254 RepID=A0AAV3P1N4_LITER
MDSINQPQIAEIGDGGDETLNSKSGGNIDSDDNSIESIGWSTDKSSDEMSLDQSKFTLKDKHDKGVRHKENAANSDAGQSNKYHLLPQIPAKPFESASKNKQRSDVAHQAILSKEKEKADT